MSKFKKKKGGDLPAISTASLPDIVFMLLFFFMVATVMRDSTLMVVNVLPTADQIQKLDKKDRVMYIYAGKPSSRYTDKYGTGARIQLNDKFEFNEELKLKIKNNMQTNANHIWRYATGIGESKDKEIINKGWILEE